MNAITLLTVLAVLLPITLQQTPDSNMSRREEGTIRLHARVVNLNIKVVDPSGRPLPQLKREEFVVLEDNIPQEIT